MDVERFIEEASDDELNKKLFKQHSNGDAWPDKPDLVLKAENFFLRRWRPGK